jgi:RNA polymerase sigma-70 factor, ECF subfamily
MQETFESYRPMLFSIAYRMLGSAMEAEDMVQDTFLRYQATPPDSIRSLKNFLGTVITRLCLNHLNSARMQRETYIGPWLPEPVLTEATPWLVSPAAHASQSESISMAFLVLLESLTPDERAVFLLREVFDYEYEEIAHILGKEPATCRQLLSRAKKHVAEHRPRFTSTPEEQRQIVGRFMEAVVGGELDGLMNLLAEDVTLWADGGGKVRGAATHPIHGRNPVASFILASPRFAQGQRLTYEITEINGEPGIILRGDEGLTVVMSMEVAGGRIQQMRFVANPEKLKGLQSGQ